MYYDDFWGWRTSCISWNSRQTRKAGKAHANDVAAESTSSPIAVRRGARSGYDTPHAEAPFWARAASIRRSSAGTQSSATKVVKTTSLVILVWQSLDK